MKRFNNMTNKKNDNTSHEEIIEPTDVVEENAESKSTWGDQDLLDKIIKLEKKLKDQEEITQRAQSDYYRLKMEWDQYVTRTESMKANLKVEALVTTAQKLLPAVSQLAQTVQTMPEEFSDSSWAQGVTLVYSKISSQLDWLNIVSIAPEAWTEPDLMYHIPISSMPVENKKHQGKVVSVIETWFLYKKDDVEKVIIPAKVIVGA